MTMVIHDITEETRRRKAQTYFLANMSHEFRTPLAGMQASVELLQENLRQLSVEETQQLLNSIHLSLSMLHQLIDNLLESSKLEANHFTLNRRAVELEPLLGEAIRLIEPMIVRREQRLTLEEPLDLPTLQVDPTRTIQMIVNLLSNASKYSPVGSVIEIGVEQAKKAIRADQHRGSRARDRAGARRAAFSCRSCGSNPNRRPITGRAWACRSSRRLPKRIRGRSASRRGRAAGRSSGLRCRFWRQTKAT